MSVSMSALMTTTTYEALLRFSEHQEESGRSMCLPVLSGSLISDALRFNGFLLRSDYVKSSTEPEG